MSCHMTAGETELSRMNLEPSDLQKNHEQTPPLREGGREGRGGMVKEERKEKGFKRKRRKTRNRGEEEER